MTTEELITRADVIDVLNRFVRGVDCRDYASMRACLADEVEFDYRALDTTFPRSADLLVEQVRERHRGLHGLQHLTANHIVDREGPDALCSCNYVASHVVKSTQGEAMWTVAGRYDYRLVRTGKGWKIAQCRIHVAWMAGDRAAFQAARTLAGPRQDPVGLDSGT